MGQLTIRRLRTAVALLIIIVICVTTGLNILFFYKNRYVLPEFVPTNKTIDHRLLVNCSLNNSEFLNGQIETSSKKSPAHENEFPYVVYLLITKVEKKNHSNIAEISFCGGSILNSTYVITAASCVFPNSKLSVLKVEIIAGALNSTDIFLQSLVQGTSEKEIIVHEDYNPETLENDIALIEVKEKFKLKDPDNKRAGLVDEIEILEEGIETSGPYKMAGWDAGEDSCKRHSLLQTVQTNESWTGIIFFNNNGKTIHTRSARLRAGGPLLRHISSSPDKIPTNYLVGILSKSSESEDVYTRISYYYNWIKNESYDGRKIVGILHDLEKKHYQEIFGHDVTNQFIWFLFIQLGLFYTFVLIFCVSFWNNKINRVSG